MTTADHDASSDDTVSMTLADELLAPGEPTAGAPAEPPPSAAGEWADDEDFQPIERKRNRWTTVLGVALIFMFGVLCGSILTHVLAPTPAPPTVYVLNGAGSASTTGSPSAAPPSTGPSSGEQSPTAGR